MERYSPLLIENMINVDSQPREDVGYNYGYNWVSAIFDGRCLICDEFVDDTHQNHPFRTAYGRIQPSFALRALRGNRLIGLSHERKNLKKIQTKQKR